jgi:uncharacterized protein YuzE
LKLHYGPETDSLYILLLSKPGWETPEVAVGRKVDLDEAGKVIGFDIGEALMAHDNLSLETIELPLLAMKAA